MSPINRILHRRISNEQGMSLMEILFALVLLTGGLMAYTRFTAGVVDRNDANYKSSTAITYAQEKIEDLKNLAQDVTLDATDGGTDTLESTYTRVWTLTNNAGGGNPWAGNVATITVTVSWPDNPTAKQVTLSTQLFQP